jgi:hypothetical protein
MNYPVETQLRVANAYKMITLVDLSKTQIDKFCGSVEREQPKSSGLNQASFYIKLGELDVHSTASRISYEPAPPFYVPERSGGKTMPSPSGVVPRDQKHFVSLFEDYVRGIYPTDWDYDLVLSREFSESLSWLDTYADTWERIQEIREDALESQQYCYTNGLDCPSTMMQLNKSAIKAGNIGVTQEPGGKARWFANPNPILQNMTVPLFNALHECVNRDPNDFSLDQDAGITYVFRKIRTKRKCHFFDLSNATDTFPLALQLEWLRRNNYDHSQLRLLFKASRGVWYIPALDREISWNVGQPLGLKPSFYAFSTTHSMLIRGIFASLGKEPEYALVGDDVAIFDNGAASIYSEVMSGLGIQLSSAKLSSGTRYVEFCGKIVDEVSNTISIGKMRPIKATNIFSSFGIYGVSVGYEIYRYLRNVVPGITQAHVSRTLLALERLPQPYGNGRGEGESLESRFSKYALIVDKLLNAIAVELVKPSIAGQRNLIALWEGTQRKPIPNSSDVLFNDGRNTLAADGIQQSQFISFPAGLTRRVESEELKHLNNLFRGILKANRSSYGNAALRFWREISEIPILDLVELGR